jgi:hypothetical protein
MLFQRERDLNSNSENRVSVEFQLGALMAVCKDKFRKVDCSELLLLARDDRLQVRGVS